MARLKEVIRAFGRAIDIDQVDGVERLVFDPRPERRWEILKLLDDDYLTSTLTERQYEVNSKSSVG